MKLIPATALILAAVTLSAADAAKPAKESKAADHRCFWARNVNNFEAVDDTHVNIRVGVKDVYAMTLFGPWGPTTPPHPDARITSGARPAAGGA